MTLMDKAKELYDKLVKFYVGLVIADLIVTFSGHPIIGLVSSLTIAVLACAVVIIRIIQHEEN